MEDKIAEIRHLLKVADDENKRLESELTRQNELIESMAEALSNLIFTASKLWDDTEKPIMSGGAITVTHPIIEQAREALKKYQEYKRPT